MHFYEDESRRLISEIRLGLIGCGEHRHELKLLGKLETCVEFLGEEVLEKEELERQYGQYPDEPPE